MEPLLAALFDARCAGCEVPLARPLAGPLCGTCWASLPRPPAASCGCGAPGVPRCARCRRARNPFARGASLGLYEGLLRRVVHALKYDGRHRLADGLAERLLAAGALPLLEDAVLVPVPLHPRRERGRGYNQCALLARALGRRAGRPVVDALARLRDTPAQAGLTAAARRANVEGAFAVRRRRDVRGRVVVLVEDVVTTGATVRACAAALLRAGAAEVRLVCVARVA